MTERVSTGISGLDKLVQGGFEKGSTILVTGNTGCGKTIFCCQYIWEGLKRGENCMFITFEESMQDIINDAAAFGWDFKKYEKEGKFNGGFRTPFKKEDLFWFRDDIKNSKINRIVLDSTSVLSLFYKDPYDIRIKLFELITSLKETGATSVLTTETTKPGLLSRFGVEEFVVDGVLLLQMISAGETCFRTMQVRKMRRTEHGMSVYPYQITKKGIVVQEGTI
ncbi:MAG: hypothetical protein HZB68_02990 [Candidatus Aenigmarchaeota archaeon]|nr:hypothetical protein [Candidatus Aenigmarchaeota archaeon]